MKIKNLIRVVAASLVRWLRFGSRRHNAPAPPPGQLDLGLDPITETGLRLHKALPVRSAEYLLQRGKPALAVQELVTRPAAPRRHVWPLRVQLDALHAATR